MHRKSLTGEAKLNRDKAMLNDYIAGMHIAELAEKYGIGCTNVKKSLEVLEGFDAVRRNDRKSPNRKPNNQKRLSKADMEQRNIEIAQDYKNGAWTFESAEQRYPERLQSGCQSREYRSTVQCHAAIHCGAYPEIPGTSSPLPQEPAQQR